MTEASPWSDKVRLVDAVRGPATRRLAADESARSRIADTLGLDRLHRLEAEATLGPWRDGAVLDASWSATVEQTCGVTLEPFTSELAGEFTVRLVPEGSPNAPQDGGGEVMIDPDAEDPPDVLEDGAIDVAAYVVEHLALEIDPFPRKPGAVFEPPELAQPPSPFEALRSLKPTPKAD